ncbi:hypothetical protein DWU98_06500 [Dyella monticola]|uniref:Dermonecrotic toxin N-terminal domain-containing protein n=2 Tax=Dyella monticola TaxID=1927958 RepID=A0A370X3C3_9GAMM|nr:hypothetical protein DWU98_06500 [Dyella monticola]
MHEPRQQAATMIRLELKRRFDLDVDPDQTYLPRVDRNTKEQNQHSQAGTQSGISLTEALLREQQDHETPSADAIRTSVSLDEGDHWHIRCAPLSPSSGSILQLDISPLQLRDIAVRTDFTVLYLAQLDKFWKAHEEHYGLLAKIAFLKAATLQHGERSLTDEGLQLAFRAFGVVTGKPWLALTPEDLRTVEAVDPWLESGILDIGQYHATDLVYVTDHTDQKTLLYIPGHSSPLHEFESLPGMKRWFAEQARDALKREVLSTHFRLADRPYSGPHVGLDETLQRLGAWPQCSAWLETWESEHHGNDLDPQQILGTAPQIDTFQTVTARQKNRSYSDALLHIVFDHDMNQPRLFDLSSAVAEFGMALTPLALLKPSLAIPGYALMRDLEHANESFPRRNMFGVINARSTLSANRNPNQDDKPIDPVNQCNAISN